MAAVKATIKKWLDSTPAFSAAYFSKYLIVRDVVHNGQLAVIDFEDDHLAVNTPMVGGLASLSIGAGGKKVYYSDPRLQQRVKYLVNQAYDRQASS